MTHRSLLAFALVLVLLGGVSAQAAQIAMIDVPRGFASYDPTDNSFDVSGNINNAAVHYVGGAVTVIGSSFFSMDSGLLDATLGSPSAFGNQSISYVSNGGLGSMSWLDNAFNPLLIGDLVALEMQIVNPSLGLYEGTGTFDVTGGAMAGDFGANGGLAQIGLAFTVPLSFDSPFSAQANTQLFPLPDDTMIPEPTAAIVFGLGLLGIAQVVKRQTR